MDICLEITSWAGQGPLEKPKKDSGEDVIWAITYRDLNIWVFRAQEQFELEIYIWSINDNWSCGLR